MPPFGLGDSFAEVTQGLRQLGYENAALRAGLTSLDQV